MSAIETTGSKRLVLVSGRATLRSPSRSPRSSGPTRADRRAHLRERRDLRPLRRERPRLRRVRDPVAHRADQRVAHGAAHHDRCAERASAKRITVVARSTPTPGRTRRAAARAHLGSTGRRPLQGRRRRPHHVDRPARRADPGLLRRPRRPPLRDARAARALPEKLDPATLTVVSPDMGRVRVADIWSDKLGAPLAIIHKRRDPLVPNQVSVHEIVGDVEGRVCLLSTTSSTPAARS